MYENNKKGINIIALICCSLNSNYSRRNISVYIK